MGLRIAITGGAGFLGSELARTLLEAGQLALAGEPRAPIDEIVILDLIDPPAALGSDPRVTTLTGELTETLPRLGDVDLLCHLAGVVSGAAELDFDLGMRTNLDALRDILEFGRHLSTPPVLLFTSSLAVFGSDPAIGPIGAVDDDTLPRPQSSYGVQKFIGEQLVADYTRKGFVRGRTVRLMTVAVRPGRPNAAASSFISSIVREPLAGIRATCPVPPSTPIALSSPGRTLAGILRAIEVDESTWGSRTAVNLPALTTTPAEMMAALDRVAGAGTSDLVDWTIDESVLDIVGSWPSELSSPRAAALGLTADATFDDVIREHMSSRSSHAVRARASAAGGSDDPGIAT